MGVHPLGGAALVIAQRFGRRERDLLAPARIAVDEGHVAQTRGHLADFLGVVGGVGQVVETDDPFGAHLRERDGHLAVVQTGGREDETHGNVAVDDIQMRLVAAPVFPLALAVLLAAPVATGWQIGQIGL